MRDLADAGGVRRFMRELGRAAKEPASVFFTGGATAVLYGWRESTVDVDVRFEPNHDSLLRGVAELKESLRLNLELASPEDFVPVMSDWPSRSPFIERHGPLSFHHFDLHAQALSKVERGHEQDVADVGAMLQLHLITPATMWRYFDSVSRELFRYPALDGPSFERAMALAFGSRSPA